MQPPRPEGLAEFTLKAVAAGVVLGVVFGAANAYLGLRVGMTVSSSILAAVMTVALFNMSPPQSPRSFAWRSPYVSLAAVSGYDATGSGPRSLGRRRKPAESDEKLHAYNQAGPKGRQVTCIRL